MSDTDANALAAESLAADDPTAWFDRLYSASERGEAVVPWDRLVPQQLLVEWAHARRPASDGRRALVVGCGLGRDAEFVSGLGFETTAFDISDTAVRLAQQRYPDTRVQYVSANLLDPPIGWRKAFDVVVESYTVQSLPDPPRSTAISSVARFVAPGGTLIVIAAAHDDAAEAETGPPWPLRRNEVEAFGHDGLNPVSIERIQDQIEPAMHRWRAEFVRPE